MPQRKVKINASMGKYLDTINDPVDVRRLKIEELDVLAEELRQEVISVVSEVGGHFASTLGAIELTLALHYAFETPKDRLIWDKDTRLTPTRLSAAAVKNSLPFVNWGESVAF